MTRKPLPAAGILRGHYVPTRPRTSPLESITMSAVASSIRVSAPVKAGKAAAFNRGARVASVSDPPLSSSAPCCHAYRYPIPRGSLTNVPRFAPAMLRFAPRSPRLAFPPS